MHRRHLFTARVAAAALVVGAGAAVTLPSAPARAATQVGSDYWVTFLPNYDPGDLSPADSLSMVSASNGSVTITRAGMVPDITANFTAGTLLTVEVPIVPLTDDTVASAYHVTTTAPVTLYAESSSSVSADATLVFPTAALGTDYVDLGYTSSSGTGLTNELAVVATADNTTVSITSTWPLGTGRGYGQLFTENLNAGDVYPIRTAADGADLSGTTISADHPVAVVGGHECADVPTGVNYCDHLVEQLPPTADWGRQFVITPTATRSGGDVMRVTGLTNGTTLTYSPATPPGAPTSIDKGSTYEVLVPSPTQVTSSAPILLAQYARGGDADTSTGKPFMMLVPPAEQYLADYRFTTLVNDYAAVTVPTAAVSSVKLDGTPVDPSTFTAVDGTSWSTGALPVTAGAHRLTAARPFGLQVYGYPADGTVFVAYGVVGGMNLARIADVASVSVSPPISSAYVGNKACLTLTARDGAAAAIPGVRFDVSTTGANPSTAFRFADATGNAQYCYSGTLAGIDTITAAVGSVTGEATFYRHLRPLVKFTAKPGLRKASFTWTNPNTVYFPTTSVIRMLAGTQGPGSSDGTLVYSGGKTSATRTGLKDGKTYSFSGFARDSQGHFSARVGVTLWGTTLAVRRSASSVPSGQRVTIGTTLKQVGPTVAGVKGATVQLLARRHGTTTWRVIKTLTTGTGGKASYRFAPTRTSDYRWRFLGAGKRLGCYSALTTVQVTR